VDERRKTQALAVAEKLVQSAGAVKPGFQGAREMRAGAGDTWRRSTRRARAK
jgi:hypothetical protein